MFIEKLRSQGANSIAVGCSAWCGSVGLVWGHFGIVSPIALLVGLPMVIMVWSVLAMCCLGLAVGAVSSTAAGALANVNGALALSVRSLAGWSASVSGSHFKREAWADREQVVIYDVGNGGFANYLGLAGGVMLDCGSERFATSVLVPSLSAMGGGLNSMILTHGDALHSGGASVVLDHWAIDQCVAVDEQARSPSYLEAVERLGISSTKRVFIESGAKLPLGPNASIDILTAGEQGRTADDRVLVARLQWREKTILFAGDIGFGTLQELTRRGVNLQADIIVLSSHASDPIDIEALLRSVRPSLIILGRERYTVPLATKKSITSYIKHNEAELLDQRERGAVLFFLHKGEIHYRTMLKP